MKKQNNLLNLAFSATFLALALLLPFITGQVPQVGNMLCPMHIPVILCGFICGAPWGLLTGFIAPLLRSVIFGMPIMFPGAISMAFELATYGFMCGILYKIFPKKKLYVYISLITSMIIGRLIWGLVQFACLGFEPTKFTFTTFWAGAVTNAIPGIIIQIIIIPIIVILLRKNKFSNKT